MDCAWPRNHETGNGYGTMPTKEDVMSAAEPSNADILAALRDLATETKTRHEALANDSRQRDTAQTERAVRLETRMEETNRSLTLALTTVHADVAQLKSLFPKVESLATEAHEAAMSAQKSYDDVTVSSQEHWRSVMAGQEMLSRMLEEQNADKRRTEEAKAEARRQESLAAKRLVEEKEKAAIRAQEILAAKVKAEAEALAQKARDDLAAAAEKAHRDADERIAKWKLEAEERDRIRKSDDDRRKARYGAVQAVVLALIASAGGCGVLNARASAADAAGKIDAQTKQLSALSQRLEAKGIPGTTSYSDVVTMTASAPEPPSTSSAIAAVPLPAAPPRLAAPPPRAAAPASAAGAK